MILDVLLSSFAARILLLLNRSVQKQSYFQEVKIPNSLLKITEANGAIWNIALKDDNLKLLCFFETQRVELEN